jgi:signal transduction histidine kinase
MLTEEKKSLHAELSSVGRDAEKLRWQKQHLQDQILTLKKDQSSLVTHFRMLTDLAKKETIEAYQKYLAMVMLEIEEKMRLQDDGFKGEPTPSVPEEQLDTTPNRYAKFPNTVEQVIKNLQPIMSEKDLSTEIMMPESMPSLLMSEALFEEILTILLTNAVEETQQDGEITIRTKIYQEDESLQFAHIKIADQGEGFNPEDLNQVLNYQLSDDPDMEITQQLTNLYVTKNLVENEGGRMWVESKPSGGTVVSLLLPLQGS